MKYFALLLLTPALWSAAGFDDPFTGVLQRPQEVFNELRDRTSSGDIQRALHDAFPSLQSNHLLAVFMVTQEMRRAAQLSTPAHAQYTHNLGKLDALLRTDPVYQQVYDTWAQHLNAVNVIAHIESSKNHELLYTFYQDLYDRKRQVALNFIRKYKDAAPHVQAEAIQELFRPFGHFFPPYSSRIFTPEELTALREAKALTGDPEQ